MTSDMALRTVMLLGDPSADFGRVAEFTSGLKELGAERVIVAHVFEASGLEGPVIAAKTDAIRDALTGFAEPLRAASLDVVVRVATGEPARELRSMADSGQPDLVVAGSHAKSVGERLFGGSVSESVASHAEVPVLLVRYDTLDEMPDRAGMGARIARSVVVPTDFSEAAERASDLAAGLAAAGGGTVHLVTVADEDDADAAATLERRAAELRASGVEVTAAVHSGAPGEAICDAAREHGATLIVMGTRGRSALGDALLGSVSMHLVRHSAVPVVMVP